MWKLIVLGVRKNKRIMCALDVALIIAHYLVSEFVHDVAIPKIARTTVKSALKIFIRSACWKPCATKLHQQKISVKYRKFWKESIP